MNTLTDFQIITQQGKPAFMERRNARLRKSTLEKLAKAMRLALGQLR